MSSGLIISPELIIPAEELEWTAVRSGGPGGQNVNKVATKVELRFQAATSAVLSEPVRARLLALARGRLDAEGRIVITCEETRSQSRNLELARARLAELVARAVPPPKRRRATKPSRAAKARRVSEKRQEGEKKLARRKGSWD